MIVRVETLISSSKVVCYLCIYQHTVNFHQSIKDLMDVLMPYAVGSRGKIKKTYVKRIGDKEVGVMELAVASDGKIGLKRVYIWWDEKNDSIWMFSAETNKRSGFEYIKEIEHIVASFRYI